MFRVPFFCYKWNLYWRHKNLPYDHHGKLGGSEAWYMILRNIDMAKFLCCFNCHFFFLKSVTRSCSVSPVIYEGRISKNKSRMQCCNIIKKIYRMIPKYFLLEYILSLLLLIRSIKMLKSYYQHITDVLKR